MTHRRHDHLDDIRQLLDRLFSRPRLPILLGLLEEFAEQRNNGAVILRRDRKNYANYLTGVSEFTDLPRYALCDKILNKRLE